jgi:hypothetical protein
MINATIVEDRQHARISRLPAGNGWCMNADGQPSTPNPGEDSRVEDWFGQSVDHDAELAESLSEELPPDEAEAAFEAQAHGRAEQERRHGSSIDPEQGESAYRQQDGGE